MAFEDRWTRGKTFTILSLFQILFVILFGIFVEYDSDAQPKHGSRGHDSLPLSTGPTYGMFQDVHVMIFIGFGFLMTFLKRYGYSAVGLNMLVAAFVLQWATLIIGFFHLNERNMIVVNMETLLTADFAAAAVLISFGAVLGKVSLVQAIIMAFFEIVVFQANEYLGLKVFKVTDVGGSMFVHAFGAYFGIAVARVLYNDELHDEIHDHHKWAPCYHSDHFSMIGTLFLWVFWPSFNSVVSATDDGRYRAVINTYFALSAGVIMSFAVSSLVDKKSRFEIDHIQNATIAAGVAVGTSADLMLHPYGSILVGCVAGAVATLGLKYLEPFLAVRMKTHDTCGVNNLHGMPGLIAGIVGAIMAALATPDIYGEESLYKTFPARTPTNLTGLNLDHLGIDPGYGRSAGTQGGYQMAALMCTLVIAVVSGILVGFILRLPIWNQPHGEHLFDDDQMWVLPEDYTGIQIKSNRELWDDFKQSTLLHQQQMSMKTSGFNQWWILMTCGPTSEA
ncbi:unnamed protein product [Owenia fusiformis]|uniref:Ammonium transporter AmtB-like domain-containing protein n=1 Tax=Owenia fusiformis TaxID=6347 RepID=A0A8S4PT33_OWEFU|nr:unnamed protein product [Owenia fusiformis]